MGGAIGVRVRRQGRDEAPVEMPCALPLATGPLKQQFRGAAKSSEESPAEGWNLLARKEILGISGFWQNHVVLGSRSDHPSERLEQR